MSWSDEQIELLRKLHGEGMSFALISEQVGHTRNSCIGKARRLELPMRVTVTSKNEEPRPKGQKRRYFSIVRASGNGDKLRILETVQTDLPAFQCEVVPLNKTLDDLGRDDCRYIMGDPVADGAGIYCGHPAVKRSYCQAHFECCYIEPKKRWCAPIQAVSGKKPVSIHRKVVPVDSGNLFAADQSNLDLGLASPETEAA
jgi:hypothetical protein